jgi:hypothetical protein
MMPAAVVCSHKSQHRLLDVIGLPVRGLGSLSSLLAAAADSKALGLTVCPSLTGENHRLSSQHRP